jgi:hypothetical protein
LLAKKTDSKDYLYIQEQHLVFNSFTGRSCIAGCKEIVLCSPPDKRKYKSSYFAANLCGVTKILKVGGMLLNDFW